MIGLFIATWLLAIVTFLIGYFIGRLSLTPVKEEDDE